MVKNLSAMQEMPERRVQSLGREDPLEEEKATHSSVLAWGNPTDRGARWATVHGVAKKSDTTARLSTHSVGIRQRVWRRTDEGSEAAVWMGLGGAVPPWSRRHPWAGFHRGLEDPLQWCTQIIGRLVQLTPERSSELRTEAWVLLHLASPRGSVFPAQHRGSTDERPRRQSHVEAVPPSLNGSVLGCAVGQPPPRCGP